MENRKSVVYDVLLFVYDVMSGIGNTSHHPENLSTHVNKYDCPSHLESGQVMSTWICLNLSSGAENSPTGVCVCRLTLALWHFCRNFGKELVILFHRTAAAPWGHVASIIKRNSTGDSPSFGSTPTTVSNRSFS